MSSSTILNEDPYEDQGNVVHRVETKALELRHSQKDQQQTPEILGSPTYIPLGGLFLLRGWGFGGYGGNGGCGGYGGGNNGGVGCCGEGGSNRCGDRQLPPPAISDTNNDVDETKDDDEVVELNVGGVHYSTLKSILCTYKNSHLYELVMSAPKDSKGRYYIEGDGKAFRYILHFLRRGEFPWPLDPNEQKILQDELRYYHLDSYVKNEPPLPSIPSHETEFRILKAFGTIMGKLSEIDNSYLISDKLSRSCIYSLTKLQQVDQQYHIHHTIGSTLATGAGLVLHLDTKYEIHQKLTNTLISGITKAYELDQQYLIHEKMATVLVTGYSVAQTLNDRYQIHQKIGNSLKTSFQIVSDFDQQFKVQERIGRFLVAPLSN